MTTLRKILHIDMDAFYAAIEQRDHPVYRGQPLVVGGQPESRGAVAAASYEARQYGIHSAMPSRVAVQRCPQLIFVKPRFEVYRAVSQEIRAIFASYADLVEPLALDEAYLDVTENKRSLPSAVAIAKQIREAIYQTTGLTASAGVSINKFLAKMASGMKKPNGLYVILPAQADVFVEALPIGQFHGVGPATAAKMERLGIHTGADLKQWSELELVAHFGKVGHHYYRVARGQDDRPVDPHRIRKSIGAERSFAEDFRDLTAMETALQAIAHEVETRLQRAHRVGYTLTLKIKYADYQQITRSRTVTCPLEQAMTIVALAEELLHLHRDPGRPVRLLGITLANLADVTTMSSYIQLPLPLVL
jgi:DNA polymerase-4